MIRLDQGGREENEAFRSAEEDSFQNGVHTRIQIGGCNCEREEEYSGIEVTMPVRLLNPGEKGSDRRKMILPALACDLSLYAIALAHE